MTAMDTESYRLVLYVAGSGARSLKTEANLRRICSHYLGGRHQFEVIDVRRHPDQAETANILITPTLVRETPAPPRRVVGDLSDTEAVLFGLDLSPEILKLEKGDDPA